jgi:hypothetical protein
MPASQKKKRWLYHQDQVLAQHLPKMDQKN